MLRARGLNAVAKTNVLRMAAMSVASNASHSVSVGSIFRNLFAAVTTKRTRTGAHSDGRPVQVASTSKFERTASVKVSFCLK